MKATLAAMLFAVVLMGVSVPAPAVSDVLSAPAQVIYFTDDPPPPDCAPDSPDDPDCQPQHHRKFCGFAHFPIRCLHHDPPPPQP